MARAAEARQLRAVQLLNNLAISVTRVKPNAYL